jgi:hypothetical protein
MLSGTIKLMVKKERICNEKLDLPRHLPKKFTLQLLALAHSLRVCRTEHRQLRSLFCLHSWVLRGHRQTCTILSLAHATERSNMSVRRPILIINLENKMLLHALEQ